MNRSSQHRARTGSIVIVAAAITAIILGIVTPLALYVFPFTPTAQQADAVVVLGPAFPERVAYGEQLREATGTPELVISTMPWKESSFSSESVAACSEVNVTCFVPEPRTTRGEADAVRQLALEEGWTKVTVVTMTPHVSRARLIFAQCTDLEIAMSASPERLTTGQITEQVVYQTGALVKAALVGCV